MYLTNAPMESCWARESEWFFKTVSQAIEDGDSIYAVVKAASVNNDGRTARLRRAWKRKNPS